MKKIIYAGLSLTLLGATFFACEKEVKEGDESRTKYETRTADDGDVDADADRIAPADMEYIGIAHNDGLDDVYANYEEEGIPGSADESKDRVLNIMSATAAADPTADEETKDLVQFGVTDMYENGLPYEIENFHGGCELTADMGTTEKAYLDDLYDILGTEGLSADEMSAEIGGLEATIYADMSMDNQSLYMLYSATQVARYSYRYWWNNWHRWGLWGHWRCIPIRLVLGDVWAIVHGQYYLIITHPLPHWYAGWWHYGGPYGYGFTPYSCFGTLYFTHYCLWYYCWWPYCY